MGYNYHFQRVYLLEKLENQEDGKQRKDRQCSNFLVCVQQRGWKIERIESVIRINLLLYPYCIRIGKILNSKLKKFKNYKNKNKNSPHISDGFGWARVVLFHPPIFQLPSFILLHFHSTKQTINEHKVTDMATKKKNFNMRTCIGVFENLYY